MEMALDHVASTERPLHLSYDIDSVDPTVAPSTGTTVPGGLNYREAHYVAEAMADTGMSMSCIVLKTITVLLSPALGIIRPPRQHGLGGSEPAP